LVQSEEESKAKKRVYENRPEVIARAKKLRNTPERKAKTHELRNTPEEIAKRKAYNATPERIAKRRTNAKKPEVIAKRRAKAKTPEARAKQKASTKKYYAKPEKRAKRSAYSKRPEVRAKQKARKSTPEAKVKIASYEKERRETLKEDVFSHYSKIHSNSDIPCCRCCGESSHMEFLTMDHIAGRKQMDSEPELLKLGYSSKLSAQPLNVWIIDNNFPEGFQILCINCNFAKGHSKDNKCPHQLDRMKEN